MSFRVRWTFRRREKPQDKPGTEISMLEREEREGCLLCDNGKALGLKGSYTRARYRLERQFCAFSCLFICS